MHQVVGSLRIHATAGLRAPSKNLPTGGYENKCSKEKHILRFGRLAWPGMLHPSVRPLFVSLRVLRRPLPRTVRWCNLWHARALALRDDHPDG